MKHFSFLNRHGQGIDSPGNATPVTYDTQSAYGKSAKTHQRNKAYANPRCIDESIPLQTQLVQKRTRAGRSSKLGGVSLGFARCR